MQQYIWLMSEPKLTLRGPLPKSIALKSLSADADHREEQHLNLCGLNIRLLCWGSRQGRLGKRRQMHLHADRIQNKGFTWGAMPGPKYKSIAQGHLESHPSRKSPNLLKREDLEQMTLRRKIITSSNLLCMSSASPAWILIMVASGRAVILINIIRFRTFKAVPVAPSLPGWHVSPSWHRLSFLTSHSG